MTWSGEVYDVHTHVGPFGPYEFADTGPTHLIGSMDECNVRVACLSHTSALLAPSRGNADTIDLVRQHSERFRGLALVYPQYPELTEGILKEWDQLSEVFVGFKLHPDRHDHPVSGPGYERVLAFADEREAIVLVHTWGVGHVQDRPEWRRSIREVAGPEQFRRAAERYHRAKLIAAHAFNGSWEEAVRLTRDFPNVYLDTSTVNDRGAIEFLCEGAPSGRVLFGSDYPFVGVRYSIGCVLAADIGETDQRDILCHNAKRLLEGARDA